jgi:FMN phosphatase YigB (HAD superfamily)
VTTMNFVTIFDLDGVLIDNVAYECAVTDLIVKAISKSKMMTFDAALSKWNERLATSSEDPRWHDYSLHCAALGVSDASQSSHEAARYLIRQLPKAVDSIRIASEMGECWLASDATNWVACFKLEAAGIDPHQFSQIFTLDRCGVSKGYDEFWECVAGCIDDSDTAVIYIDNRLDRLLTAAKTLPRCRMVHVAAEDHPSNLGLFPKPASVDQLQIPRVTHEHLPEALQCICREVAAVKRQRR